MTVVGMSYWKRATNREHASYTSKHWRPFGSARLVLPLAEVAARHELCEDLAQAMTEPARTMLFGAHLAEDEVLRRCLAGLRAEGAGLAAAEALWVVRRLAELLDWEQPEFPETGE